jgi:hypothetical protein
MQLNNHIHGLTTEHGIETLGTNWNNTLRILQKFLEVVLNLRKP